MLLDTNIAAHFKNSQVLLKRKQEGKKEIRVNLFSYVHYSFTYTEFEG